MVVVPDDGSIDTVLRQAIGRCDLIISPEVGTDQR